MSVNNPRAAGWPIRLVLMTMIGANAGCGGGGGTSASSNAGSSAGSPPVATTPTIPTPETPANNPSNPRLIVSTTKLDASRFLEQASFGPTQAEVDKVMSLGIEAYLDDQFTKAKTGYVGFKRIGYVAADDCKTQANDPTGVASLCARDNYTLFEVQRQFFANAINGEDQLRQRVAFALSQIFVVSGTEIKHAYAMAKYQNLLLDDAFGNFRDLLTDVTINPAMGLYLDMVNNDKENLASGAKPNENYAREFLQLFTIGTVRLNPDGSVQSGGDGEPLAAYSQEDVEALARVFTGWTFSVWEGQTSHWVNPPKIYGTLAPIDSHHDTTAKQLLGVAMPAGRTAQADLDQALDIAFNHPNVGPFIALRLIQHLVTSNPSPAYIARVASVFNDNGHGVRGDLAATVRAILLDSEARGSSKENSAYGRLKDPALFITGFVRALGGKSDGVFLRTQSAAMGQDIFTAPSVFNYYSPMHRISAGALLGPEFGIFDGVSALARIDFVYQLVYANGAVADPTVANSIGTSIAFDSASATPNVQLASDFDARLMFGKLSDASYKSVNDAIAALPVDDLEGRARAAAYLLGVSAQYQVQR